VAPRFPLVTPAATPLFSHRTRRSIHAAVSGLTLRQLEIFAQVVEHGSFRKCAEHLGVSQVSVSEHVRELENRLGVSLFHRNAGGPATLTCEGERAYRRVTTILADLHDLCWEAAGGRAARRRLRVAMHGYLMRHLREALLEFRRAHPQIEVTLDFEPASPERLRERVQSRELEAAYFLAFDSRDLPESKLLQLDPLAVFVAHDHPLASKPIVTSADIRATPAIHLGPRNPLRPVVERALEQAGCAGSPLALEADEYGLILTSAGRGDGFVCMFESLAGEAAQLARLVTLRLEHPVPALQVRQIARHSAGHDPVVSELIHALGDAFRARENPHRDRESPNTR
jgi:DNA-binding transcriptional LysR family regulator